MDADVRARACWCYTSCMGPALYPQLTPSFHGSMALRLDFAPIGFAPLCFVTHLFFSPRWNPRPVLLFPIVSFPHTTLRLNLLRSFVLLLARAPCRFRDFNARQLLFSPPSPPRHHWASPPPPTHWPLAYSFARLVPSPFRGYVFPWPTGIFPSVTRFRPSNRDASPRATLSYARAVRPHVADTSIASSEVASQGRVAANCRCCFNYSRNRAVR